MVLDKIVTLASSQVRLRFNALERSLRATGCNLPLWVIPYNNDKFDLPENAAWWEVPEVIDWLGKHNAHPMMRKYQCLTIGNYQFVDSDVIFLSNPEVILKGVEGFVASCGHWHSPGHTYTKESLKYLKQKSTLWQKFVFNAGQFACDRPLYTIEELKAKAELPDFKYPCLQLPYHDQPGLNLLVNTSSVPVTNLTLPPYNMESTWAGDYINKDYNKTWSESTMPYLIHWAGCKVSEPRGIDELIYKFFTKEEMKQWQKEIEVTIKKERAANAFPRQLLQKIKKSIKGLTE